MKKAACIILSLILLISGTLSASAMDSTNYDPGERYFILRVSHPGEYWSYDGMEWDTFKGIVDKGVAANFNAFIVHPIWNIQEVTDGVYDFSRYDSYIDYITKTCGKKVAIVIKLCVNTLATKDQPSYLNDEDYMLDMNGDPVTGSWEYGKMVSFSSENAVKQMTDYFEACVKHYEEKYGDDVLMYIPAFSCWAESEYWPGASLDYSEAAKEAYAKFLEKKYSTTEQLAKYTGVKYDSFEQVPYTDVTDTSKAGTLWYQFRTEQLANILGRLGDILHKQNPNAKMGLSLGNAWDHSGLTRASLDLHKVAEKADVVFVDCGGAQNHEFAMSYLRGVFGEEKEFANEIDGKAQAGASVENYTRQGLTSFANGAKYVSVANWSYGSDEDWIEYSPVWKTITETWITGKRPATYQYGENSAVCNISLNQLFNCKNGVLYESAYSAMENPTKINLIDDLELKEIKENVSRFNFAEDYSPTAGRWSYVFVKNSGTTGQLTYQDCWRRGDAYVNQGIVRPTTVDVGTIFNCKRQGTLSIKLDASLYDGRSTGVQLTVYKNNIKVYPIEKECIDVKKEEPFTGNFDLSVDVDDQILFKIAAGEDAVWDTTIFDTTIEQDTTRIFSKSDVNLNGKTDSGDYLMTKRFFSGAYKLNEQQYERADMDSNGKITSVDYLRIRNMFKGS